MAELLKWLLVALIAVLGFVWRSLIDLAAICLENFATPPDGQVDEFQPDARLFGAEPDGWGGWSIPHLDAQGREVDREYQ